MLGEDHLINIGKNRNIIRLADRAANDIRKMILHNKFDPGEPLSEPRLAEMLGMSRTPIREAITLLEQEGLLRTVGGKGAFVMELNKKTFQEVNDLRIVLEPMAAASSMYLILPEIIERQIATWTSSLEEIENNREVPVENLSDSDDELHFSYIDSCENERLRNFLRILRFQTDRYIYAHWSAKRFDAETMHQHLDILHAFQNHDTEALKRAVEIHIAANNDYIGIYTSA